MYLSRDWKDYEIIAASNGEKLERWGEIFLLRPSLRRCGNIRTALTTKSFTRTIFVRIQAAAGGSIRRMFPNRGQ